MTIGNGHPLPGDAVEEGQGQPDQQDGEKVGEGYHEQRFTIELADDLPAQGADRFPDAYLFCPFFAAGRAEVHKIDTGEDQYEDADDRKQPYIGDQPACLYTVAIPMRTEMPIIHGMQEELCPEFLILWVHMGLFTIRDLFRHRLEAGVVRYLYEHLKGVVVPYVR